MRNVAKYSPPLFPKPAGALHDHEILAQIARRLRKAPGSCSGRVCAQGQGCGGAAARLRTASLDWMLKTGRYGVPYAGRMKLLAALPGFGALRKLMRATDRRPVGLTLQRLLDAPNGVDLGALEAAFPRRIATPNRRIDLAPAMFVADLGRAAAALDEPVPSLSLIGRRHVRSNNSWLHNSQRLVKGKPRCTLMLHPDDAADRGLDDGAIARSRSRVGVVEVAVEITRTFSRAW